MNLSLFLAQLWGWVLIITCGIYLLKGVKGAYEAVINDKGAILVAGWVTLLLGLTTVILHNIWVYDWRAAITILGWLTLIKGVLLIGFEDFYGKIALPMIRSVWLSRLLLIVGLLLGIWLVYVS